MHELREHLPAAEMSRHRYRHGVGLQELAFLAAKARVPTIVAWSRPLKNGHYVCEHLATLEWEKGMDIRKRTVDVLKVIERTIRRHPSCWVLNYRYFNEGPTEEELSALKAAL